MAAVVYAFGNRDQSPRPWDNHELAELYRVVDLLSRAGLSVETDMGLSDEGEPWFAFCRADTGDVAVHIARIDGHYVAASAIMGQTCRGANFREIINQMVSQQPLVMPPPSGGNGARLFLHPAVVLTAFVATALLQAHRAEAADHPGSAVDVVLGLGQGEPGDHKLGGVSTLIKMLLADPGRPLPDRVLSRLAQEAEPGTPLASLMAIAIAAIAPLAEQSLALPDIAAVHAGTDAGIHAVPAGQLDSADTGPAAESAAPLHDTAFAAPDSGADQHDHFTPMFATSAHIMSLTAATDAAATGEHDHAVNTPNLLAGFGLDHGIIHTGAHLPVQSVESSTAQTASSSSAGSTGGSDSSTHHLSLSDLDPQALQVFTLLRDAYQASLKDNAASGTDGSSKGTDAASKGTDASSGTDSSSKGSDGGATTGSGSGSNASSPTIVGDGGDSSQAHDPGALVVAPPASSLQIKNVVLTNPSADVLLNTLSSFALDGTHQLTGQLTATADVKAAVAAYELAYGGSIQLVIFDDKDVSSPVFTFSKGVLFVEDTQVGLDAMTHTAGTVTINSVGMTMTLIGVYTIDAQHPLF